jgi:hypothetical protein
MISEKTGWYRSCYSVATSTSPVSNKTSLKTMKSILVNIARVIALCAVVAVVSATARAQLNPLYQFNGNGNWSLSAVGGGSTPVGNLLAQVPTGSTVVQAYLFSSQYYTPFTPDVTLGATTYSGSSWTALGLNTSSDLPLEAWVANVTPQMKALIGGGSVSQFSIPVFENVGNATTDGEVLAIVYSNPSSPSVTIGFLAGAASSTGATTTVNYSVPLSGVGSPGFSELMSVGDGFSYQTPGNLAQQSTITVDGRTLTQSAGGMDDGQAANGALITVGGIGNGSGGPADNPTGFNPDPTLGGVGDITGDPLGDRTDQEYYNLGMGNDVNSAPFVSNGDTSTTVVTKNSSLDDNIFFLGINVTAQAGINKPPPTTPDPASTAALLGLGLTGLLYLRRKLGIV